MQIYDFEIPEWQKRILKRLEAEKPLYQSLVMGRASGKWYFTLRALREAWKRKESTAMFSGQYDSVNRPVVIFYDVMDFYDEAGNFSARTWGVRG